MSVEKVAYCHFFEFFPCFASRIRSRAAKPAKHENLWVFIRFDAHVVKAGINLRDCGPLTTPRFFDKLSAPPHSAAGRCRFYSLIVILFFALNQHCRSAEHGCHGHSRCRYSARLRRVCRICRCGRRLLGCRRRFCRAFLKLGDENFVVYTLLDEQACHFFKKLPFVDGKTRKHDNKAFFELFIFARQTQQEV